MLKEAIQQEIKLNSDQIKLQSVSLDGKYIAFLRGTHELVILEETENFQYVQNSSFNNLFEIDKSEIEIFGNHLCWWNKENSELKVVIIDMSSMKQSMYSQNVDTERCFIFHGSLYQLIEGNIVITDFMNESKIQIFQRNYTYLRCFFSRFDEPYFCIQGFFEYETFAVESIPISDNALIWLLTIPSYMTSHHIINGQENKIISQRRTALYNTKTFYNNGMYMLAQIRIYKQLMIIIDSKLITISRNRNQKLLRSRDLLWNQRFSGDNYHYVLLSEREQRMDTYVLSTLDLRTFRIENYENTKRLFIVQDRIIQFKSDTILIHKINT